MFGDVIVPLDGSDGATRALGPATTLARRLDSPVHVVSYATEENYYQRLSEIDEQVARWSDRGVPIDVSVDSTGAVASKLIIDRLEAAPGSLVCMSTHGRGRSEAVLGSVASEVLHGTPGGVLLVGPKVDREFDATGPLLVSVDGSETSEAIIPLAIAWAIVHECPVEVVAVTEPGTVATIEAAAGLESDVSESAYVHRIANRIDAETGREANYEILHGDDPAAALVDWAVRHDIAVLAMATHGRSGFARLAAGSVSADVIRHSPCPILLMRPPDLH